MKRYIALIVTIAIAVIGMNALAEDQMAELRDIRKSAEEAIVSVKAPEPTEAPATPAPTPSPTPDATFYEPLQNGSRGDNVARLQSKLKELGYLQGSADGVFGNKTAEAVRAFQQALGLSVTGVADAETQRTLYATNSQAVIQSTFEALDYEALRPSGAQFEGVQVQFYGRVMQILTDDTYADTAGVYTVMRVATKGNAYDVVYVYAFRPADSSALREGDQVAVWGTTRGHIVYENVSKGYTDLPRVEASNIVKQ